MDQVKRSVGLRFYRIRGTSFQSYLWSKVQRDALFPSSFIWHNENDNDLTRENPYFIMTIMVRKAPYIKSEKMMAMRKTSYITTGNPKKFRKSAFSFSSVGRNILFRANFFFVEQKINRIVCAVCFAKSFGRCEKACGFSESCDR